ncbi:MAG: hypothetical protein N4A57_02590 [Anaeromicrobium sp.]|jgi:predicted nucleic acid-binding Zn ribbon protein|uniref:hypothetical protein n=1 Tax=Anaeromicrobium sp. TaxID=1929132 RepID=UPI0025D31827|nr:hypothetical protein [Anaeromicrobium sp.]MCT4593148.1 hypothetical protein [Anaeromicrobium sp.]
MLSNPKLLSIERASVGTRLNSIAKKKKKVFTLIIFLVLAVIFGIIQLIVK